MLNTKEHIDLVIMFEKDFKHYRLDKEDKIDWKRGIIYQNGELNKLFLVYRRGYAYGKCYERTEESCKQ